MPCFDANYSWQPIDTAPEDERIIVCGRQEASLRGTRAYWWYGEDAVFDGKPFEHPKATLWAPLIIPPLPQED